MDDRMDEPELKTTEDGHIAPGSNVTSEKGSAEKNLPSAEQKLLSPASHSSSTLVGSLSEGSQTKTSSTSTQATDSSEQRPSEENPFKNPSEKTSKGQGAKGLAKTSRVVKTGRRSSQSSKGETPLADKRQKLEASPAAPSVLPQADSKGESNMDMMAKMMMMMSKGRLPGMPKNPMADMKAMMGKEGMPGMPNNPMADMKAMMGKEGMPGMPNNPMADMKAMMGKEGMPKMPGMPNNPMADMKAMMGKGGGGMMDMMSMMGGGAGGMPAMMSMMMNKGESGMNASPMASMFDCLINFSLARVESDNSGDDEDSISLDIPCKHCSRLFGSQMSLKTHVLVAHDHDDTSVLNIKKIAFDGKGKRGIKDQHGTRCKQSRDCEKSVIVEAKHLDGVLHSDSTILKVNSPEESSAAEPNTRGIKRRHSNAKEGIEANVMSGEPGMEENLQPPSDHLLCNPAQVGLGISETRKHKVRLGSQHLDSDQHSAKQAAKKKIRSDVEKPKSDSSVVKDSSEGEATQRTTVKMDKVVDIKSQGSRKVSAKQSKTGTKDSSTAVSPSITSPSLRGRKTLAKDASGESKRGAAGEPAVHKSVSCKGRQSGGGASDATVATSSNQKLQTSSPMRRSLRSRKSH